MTVDIYEESKGRHTHYADVDSIKFIPPDREGFLKIVYFDPVYDTCVDFVSTKSINRVVVKELAVKTNDNIDE